VGVGDVEIIGRHQSGCQAFAEPLRCKQTNPDWLSLMRRFLLVLLFLAPVLGGCNRKSASSQPALTGEIRVVTPFTQPSVQNGKLYMSKGRLRVDFGPTATVYIVSQKKGWQMFPALKQYLDIGEKQVSTYLPHLTNGSPCPNAEQPSGCKMVGKEKIEGRSATKWELVNQHGVRVYLWTDDELEVALRWQIENVTYELSGIHEGEVADKMFELPFGYTKAPEKWGQAFGSSPK
jgi:hypothetical protein